VKVVLGRMWKKAVMARLKIQYQYLLGTRKKQLKILTQSSCPQGANFNFIPQEYESEVLMPVPQCLIK
jgi:hypothetical protein